MPGEAQNGENIRNYSFELIRFLPRVFINFNIHKILIGVIDPSF